MKTQNLNSLGTDYNIIGDNGVLVKVIKIIQHEDILDSAIGTYEDNTYMTIDEYITASNKKLCGFAPDPNSVFWYKSEPEDFNMMDVIDACISADYDYAIVEVTSEV